MDDDKFFGALAAVFGISALVLTVWAVVSLVNWLVTK